MLKRILPLMMVLSIFVSCTQKAIVSKKAEFFLDGVDIERSNNEKDIPVIEKVIRDKNQIGPSPINESYSEVEKKRLPVVAIELGPSLNRAVVYSAVFKGLERGEVPVHIVSGVGMGALSAAFYARGDTPELVEWKFHNLMAKLNGKRVYSSDWKESLYEFIKKEFKNVRIENLKKALILPVFDKKSKEVIYLKKGLLFDVLISNFNFERSRNYSKGYISAMEWKPFSGNRLKKYGADIVLSFDTLGKDISFLDYYDEYIFGLYNKTSSLISKEVKNEQKYFKLPVSSMPLDGKEKIQDYILKSLEFMDGKTKDLRKMLDDWNTSKSDSENFEGMN